MSSGPDDDDRGEVIPPDDTVRPDQTLRVDRSAVIERLRQSWRKGSLLVIAGAPADVGLHLLVEGEVVIGREPSGLHLRDSQVSWRHVTVEQQEGGYLLKDLGSTNGTLLNGVQAVEPRTLQDGDQIQLGTSVIKFMLVDETEADYLRRIAHFARTDSLTGLAAKHRFDALLDVAVKDARARNTPLSVLMMDMDNLKEINTRHGHQTGAGTIRQVGQLIGEIVAGQGEAARFGGDEFCVYLQMGLAPAMAVGEQIRTRVAQTALEVEGNTIRTSISIGAAQIDEQTTTGGQLLGRADQALYRAKAGGRNRVSE